MNIIQIVPRVPPAVCGVGDYATVLARALETHHGIRSRFISGAPDPGAGHSGFGFPVHALREQSAEQLFRCISENIRGAAAIVLQYSGYGFSKRGVPLWLLRALKQVKALHPRVALVTMFHELYASGPVTSSAFWLRPLQQQVVGALARLSAVARTNRRAYARWLAEARVCATDEIPTLPVFSNLGESRDFIPFSRRRRRIVLFQPPAVSSPEGAAYWAFWRALTQRYPDHATVAAGRCRDMPDDGSIEYKGYLEATDAADLMRDSTLSLMHYYDGYLAKSGIFAAYAAHGVGCFLPIPNRSEADGLEPGRHYLTETGPDLDAVETSARRLHAWYAGHSVEATAASYAKSLEKSALSG